MTFNATSLNVIRAERAGFVRREALRPIAEPRRVLLVTSEISELLDGERISTGFPDVAADVVVGNFLSGMIVKASLRWTSFSKAEQTRFSPLDFERLDNIDGVDEIWALCFRKPRPGWRLLGRFLEKDVFVTLGAYDRHDLAPRAKYGERARHAMLKWDECGFGSPLRGESIGDYLGGVFIDVDEECEKTKK